MGLTAIMVGPLLGQPKIFTNTAPLLGYINVYNTSAAGPLSMVLPQLGAGIQTAGAFMLVEKDPNDTAATAVTFSCFQGDSFFDGSTSLTLTNPGDQRTLEVNTVSGVFYWKAIGGLGGSSSTITITVPTDDEEGEQFGENPDDVSPIVVIDGQEITETTRFGEHLPTGSGYGGYGDGLYGYGY